MIVRLWGTRGSLAAAGPDTVAYGGDTSSVEVRTSDGRVIVLDAGSGIRRLSQGLSDCKRIDVLLTHLHMDHIQGLGFFNPVFTEVEVHIWGPGSERLPLVERLSRYLSPPLFPVRVRDLEAVFLHDVVPGTFEVGPVTVDADLVTHPGMTFGYRLTEADASLAYIPDHEPALGAGAFPTEPQWTSGFGLMHGADVLIHDAQYTAEEYEIRQGWGHTSFDQLTALAAQAEVGTLVSFHHDPSHSDELLDGIARSILEGDHPFDFVPGKEGTTLTVG